MCRFWWIVSITALLAACAPGDDSGTIPQEQREIAELELYLNGWMYLDSRINGKLDITEREALSMFREDWQIPASGGRDVTLAYLRRDHPDTSGTSAFPVRNTSCTTSNPFPQPRETASWTGGCRDGALQGRGKLTWRFLRRGEWLEQTSEGTMRDGLLQGPGRTVSPDEYVYEGDFRDSQFHGKGTMVRANGWKYSGEWLDGRPEGRGTVTSPSGEEFTGRFRRGCLPGPTGGFITFGNSERQCLELSATPPDRIPLPFDPDQQG